jgi:hypothetical protein
MSELPTGFIEDRSLRNKARAVLAEDIARIKGRLGEQGIASRVSSGVTASISSRIRSGARDVLEQAKARGGDSKGVLALLVGAILLFFARGPIISWIEELRGNHDDAEEASTPEAALPAAASAGDPE